MEKTEKNVYNDLTPDEIVKALWRIYNAPKINSFVIGFMPVSTNNVLAVNRDYYTQDGKSVILMCPGGKVHEKLNELEETYNFKFQRVNNHTVSKLSNFGLVTEEGKPIYINPISDFNFNPVETFKEYNPFRNLI